jgi:iron complex transport system substrate-binding protein
MKKRILSLLLVMLLSLTLFACGEKAASTTNEDAKTPDKKTSETSEKDMETEIVEKETSYNFERTFEVTDTTVTFEDGTGEVITLNKNPKKVVGFVNSYLGLWDLAGGDIIGRIDSEKNLPEAFKAAEVVGSMSTPNIEKLLSVEPDLVIIGSKYSKQMDMVDVLNANEIPYFAIEYTGFADYKYNMAVMCALTGREDLYTENVLAIENEISDVVSKIEEKEKPSVLLLFNTTKKTSVRLPNSMVGEMLETLNTNNVAENAQVSNESTTIFSLEKIVETDPDFIFYQTMGNHDKVIKRMEDELLTHPVWKDLKAVKNGNVFELPKDLYTYKPNKRYGEAYLKLAQMLYPDVFPITE